VCHLQNFNSFEEVLRTVNVNITGLPVFTGVSTDILVINSPAVVLCIVLQAAKVNNDRQAVAIISGFLILYIQLWREIK
jgi:hypothetical protein